MRPHAPLPRLATDGKGVCEVTGGKGLQIRRAGQLRVDRLQPSCGLQQQRRSLAAPVREERELSLHEFDAGLLKVVEGTSLCVESKSRAAPNAPDSILADAAASARSARRVGSTVNIAARSRNAAAAATPPRARARPADRSSSAATASSGPRGGMGAMPRSSVGITLLIGGLDSAPCTCRRSCLDADP